MSGFLSYLRAAFTVSLITGISEKLAPAKLSRYVEFLGGLILILLLFSPVKDLIVGLPELIGDAFPKEESSPSYESSTGDALTSLTEERLQNLIGKEVYDAFSVDPLFVEVTLVHEENECFTVTDIKVALDKGEDALREEIGRYLTNRYHTAVSVTLLEVQ